MYKSRFYFLAMLIIVCGLLVNVNPTEAQREKGRSAEIVSIIADRTQEKTILVDGSKKTYTFNGKFFRDTSGRTRTETGPIVVIQDPVARQTIVFNSDLRKGYASKWDSNNKVVSSETVKIITDLKPVTETISLGTKTISGIETMGERYRSVVLANSSFGNKRDLESTVESWLSDALQLVIMTKRTSSSGVETVEHYHNIQANAKIEPQLFESPQYICYQEYQDGRLLPGCGDPCDYDPCCYGGCSPPCSMSMNPTFMDLISIGSSFANNNGEANTGPECTFTGVSISYDLPLVVEVTSLSNHSATWRGYDNGGAACHNCYYYGTMCFSNSADQQECASVRLLVRFY
ncbi:MAG: hypothetical protein AB1489_39290 [Acidobacteriota bacterium]